MTWTKFGTEFFKECIHHGLSDAMLRTHAEAIGYLYDVEETSCRFPKRAVRLFAGSEESTDAIALLVGIEWWADHGDKYEVLHHADVVRQSLAAQVKARETSKKTSAKHRSKRAVSADDATDSTSEEEPGVTRHVTRHADSQTDKHLGGRDMTTCPHGVENGSVPDSWFKAGMACKQCGMERRGA